MSVLQTYQRFTAKHGPKAIPAVTHYYTARALATFVGPGRTCPVCGWEGKEFAPRLNEWDGAVLPKDACPRCHSLARHRAYALFYERFFRDRPAGRVLHFAAEECYHAFLPQRCAVYHRSSYEAPGSERFALDLQRLDLPDQSYDTFLLHGVLSCVEDDRAAVREMYRTLTPGGVAIVAEPLGVDGPTLDFPERRYGGICRWYGSDPHTRFAPFGVTVLDPLAGVAPEVVARCGAALTPREFQPNGAPPRARLFVLQKEGRH